MNYLGSAVSLYRTILSVYWESVTILRDSGRINKNIDDDNNNNNSSMRLAYDSELNQKEFKLPYVSKIPDL